MIGGVLCFAHLLTFFSSLIFILQGVYLGYIRDMWYDIRSLIPINKNISNKIYFFD